MTIDLTKRLAVSFGFNDRIAWKTYSRPGYLIQELGPFYFMASWSSR